MACNSRTRAPTLRLRLSRTTYSLQIVRKTVCAYVEDIDAWEAIANLVAKTTKMARNMVHGKRIPYR